MKTRIYWDTFCDENVSITRSKKYSLDKAVPKLCQTHFLLLHHIFMKKWWKCDGRQLVLIFWLTSFENSRHAKKLMINDNDDEEWAVWSQLMLITMIRIMQAFDIIRAFVRVPGKPFVRGTVVLFFAHFTRDSGIPRRWNMPPKMTSDRMLLVQSDWRRRIRESGYWSCSGAILIELEQQLQ